MSNLRFMGNMMLNLDNPTNSTHVVYTSRCGDSHEGYCCGFHDDKFYAWFPELKRRLYVKWDEWLPSND